ncbi:RNF8 [Macrobrachium rosenbergii nudivirus]|nr:RNF8 [Macrobrachium rosenbergii nudivirus]
MEAFRDVTARRPITRRMKRARRALFEERNTASSPTNNNDNENLLPDLSDQELSQIETNAVAMFENILSCDRNEIGVVIRSDLHSPDADDSATQMDLIPDPLALPSTSSNNVSDRPVSRSSSIILSDSPMSPEKDLNYLNKKEGEYVFSPDEIVYKVDDEELKVRDLILFNNHINERSTFKLQELYTKLAVGNNGTIGKLFSMKLEKFLSEKNKDIESLEKEEAILRERLNEVKLLKHTKLTEKRDLENYITLKNEVEFENVCKSRNVNLANIYDEISCTICMEIFTDPRTLGCGHTYCLECLQRIHPKRCPMCRSEFMNLRIGTAVNINSMITYFRSSLPLLQKLKNGGVATRLTEETKLQANDIKEIKEAVITKDVKSVDKKTRIDGYVKFMDKYTEFQKVM